MTRPQTLLQARAALARGHAARAAELCAGLVRANSRDVEAGHLQGRCLAALGRADEAIVELRRVLSVQSGYYPALVDLGIALASAGAFQESQTLLEAARTIDAGPAELHFGLGLCSMGLDDLTTAEAAFRRALSIKPRFPDAANNLGVVLDRLGRLPEAADCFRQAAVLHPRYALAHMNLGDALMRLGQTQAAVGSWREAATLCPQDALAQADLGAALLTAHEFAAAAGALERALALNPRLASAAANLGEALFRSGAADQAAAAYARAIALEPSMAQAHLALGRIAASQGRIEEAVSSLQTAARLKRDEPLIGLQVAQLLETLDRAGDATAVLADCLSVVADSADLHDALAQLLHRTGHLHEALTHYQRAVALDPARAPTVLNVGRVLESLGRYPDAIAAIERTLALRPGDVTALAALASCAFRICDWSLAAECLAQLREAPSGIEHLHPFLTLAADLEPAETARSLHQQARTLSRPTRSAAAGRYVHERLRVAYLSPDYRDHAVAHALAGVIARHDRQLVEPIGISLTLPDDSDIARRIKSSFGEFIDASSMSDSDVADLMRRLEIDIAIDLAGYTVGARPAIFASHAATIQVGYLGFPSSTGSDSLDFIVADDIVLPRSEEPLYPERVLRMPHCYLPFDDGRAPLDVSIGRAAAGLPPEGFVFCAFSNAYKITREMFELWMSLLREIPQSLLWLRTLGAAATANLRSSAAALGVAPERLIFALHVERMEAHLGRLRLADLFLDTRPYNAHTTAAEALWTGVPVITCRGRRFAGRVGASVLSAAGLDELICTDLGGYRALALELARSPPLLEALRRKVAACKSTAALFDTRRYTQDFEALLLGAWRERASVG